MTKLSAHCSLHGDTDYLPAEIVVRVCTNDLTRSYYQFECPECPAPVSKYASPEVITHLRTNGATMEKYAVPLEVLEYRAGPPMTADDVLDFILELGDPSHGDRLVAELDQWPSSPSEDVVRKVESA